MLQIGDYVVIRGNETDTTLPVARVIEVYKYHGENYTRPDQSVGTHIGH